MRSTSNAGFVVFYGTSLIAMYNAASVQKAPAALFSSPLGFGTGWGGSIASMSNGFSSLSSNQTGNAGQSLSLQVNGSNMGVNLLSNVISDGYANLAQSGGNSGGMAADVSASAGASGIVPESTIQLDLNNTDSVNVTLDTQAVGYENVDTILEQQAHVSSGGDSGPSGSGQAENQDGSGWNSQNGPNSYGAFLEAEQKVVYNHNS